MAQFHQPSQNGPGRVEQLRADIDAGRTGDKVAYPDPAAAPLGADDEAAAQPDDRDAARPRQAERAPPQQQSDARAGTPAGNPGTSSRTWIYIAVAIAAVVIMLLLGTMIPYQPR